MYPSVTWPRSPGEQAAAARLGALGQVRTDDDYVTRVAYAEDRGLYWVDSGTRLTQTEINHYWTVIHSRGLTEAAPYIVRNVWTSRFMPGEISTPSGIPTPGPLLEPGELASNAGGLPTWVWWAGGAAALVGVGILATRRRR